MDDKVNLADAHAQFDEPFQPRIFGTMNDYKLMVAKTKGESSRAASSTARAPMTARRSS